MPRARDGQTINLASNQGLRAAMMVPLDTHSRFWKHNCVGLVAHLEERTKDVFKAA